MGGKAQSQEIGLFTVGQAKISVSTTYARFIGSYIFLLFTHCRGDQKGKAGDLLLTSLSAGGCCPHLWMNFQIISHKIHLALNLYACSEGPSHVAVIKHYRVAINLQKYYCGLLSFLLWERKRAMGLDQWGSSKKEVHSQTSSSFAVLNKEENKP